MLYISTSVWVLRTPNAGQNLHFQHCLCYKAEKKFAAKFSKKMDFLSLHQNAVPVFYSQKKTSGCFAKRAKIDQFAKAVKVEKSKQN